MFGAVDIGGTKTLVAVFNKTGEIIERQKFATPENYDEFKGELEKVVSGLETKDFLRAVVAIPGKVDRKHGRGIVFGNLPWKHVPVGHDTERIFNAPVQVENDANLAGLSEALLVHDKYKKVLYVTISTGIGGAYVINGVLDPNTIDAEVGHMTLQHGEKFEIWEKFASGKAIVAKYGMLASEIEDPEIWEAIARNIASGFINLIAVLDPEVIIVGGGVGTHLAKFKTPLENNLRKLQSPVLNIPEIQQAQRAEEAVIYGCYEFAKQHHESR